MIYFIHFLFCTTNKTNINIITICPIVVALLLMLTICQPFLHNAENSLLSVDRLDR